MSGRKSMKGKNYKKKKLSTFEKLPSKRSKNVKFMQRGKHMEVFHRKQKLADDKLSTDPSTSTTESDQSHLQMRLESTFDILVSDLLVTDEIYRQVRTLHKEETNPKSRPICKNKEMLLSESENPIEIVLSANRDALGTGDLGKISKQDPFSQHLDYEFPSGHTDNLLDFTNKTIKFSSHWSSLGDLKVEIPSMYCEQANSEKKLALDCKSSQVLSSNDLEMMGVKVSLVANTTHPLSQLQSEFFSVLNNYQDLFYPQRSLGKSEEFRTVYCLHALNHILKTRSRIIQHNLKIKEATLRSENFVVPDGFRDQGLVRPKILFIVPFRDSAFRIINTMAQLIHGNATEECKKNGTIRNYDRFVNEYSGNTLHFSKTNPKPEDYEMTFAGNSDDNFRFGISMTKKSFKLYTDFYSSDILIASPLGLRLTGSDGGDYGFLNSIELLVIDQAEVLLAQNWENVLHVINHLHLQPQSLSDTDFQRVRPWCLSGMSRFYRQTLLLSSHELPEFRALFNTKCFNYQGKVRVSNIIKCGSIRNVIVPISQVFYRVEVSSMESLFDRRFQYFVHEVLPRFRTSSFAHCMVYVPSYFDFVRLRNYFKAEAISFVQICEYTLQSKIARARDIFFHSGAQFLLYSERSHFFRRTRIKGIRHLIMYQPPLWPHFYSEMINLLHDANQNSRDGLETTMSITMLYTKYDILQLSGIVGGEAALKLLKSGKMVHTFAAE